jgi:hypothetical protein
MAITYSGGIITVSGAYATGTANSATASTLTDTSKSWTASNPGTTLGTLGFRQVKITGGTGAGQVRGIKSNTSNTMTLFTDWDTTPDATSTYAIYYAPRDVISAQSSYTRRLNDIDAPDAMRIHTDTGILVPNGGYYGSCGNPTHIFEYTYRGIDTAVGANTAWGILNKSGFGVEGGTMVFGVNISDPTSGGKYDDGLYLRMDGEGDDRYYGVSVVGMYDFYYDAALGEDGNRRVRFDGTTSSGNGKTIIDCSFEGVSLNIGDGDTVVRTKVPSANLNGNLQETKDIEVYSNYGVDIANGNGTSFKDVAYVGFPDDVTRVTGKPVFLYHWRTDFGNPSVYFINLKVLPSKYQGNNIKNAFQFDTQASSNPDGVVWVGFENTYLVQDANLDPVEDVVVGCLNKNGANGWKTGQSSSYPYNPTWSYKLTTDANGEVTGTVIKGKIKWNGQNNPNSSGVWDTNYPLNPWTILFAKYGYVHTEAKLDPDNSEGGQVIKQALQLNPYTTVNEATAASYSDRISINWATRIITLTDDTNPQEIYNYTQYARTQGDNIQYEQLVTTSDGKNFVLNNAQIKFSGNAKLLINPELYTLVLPQGNPTPCIDYSNGTIQLGVKTGSQYTSGVAIRCEIDQAASATHDTGLNGLMCAPTGNSTFLAYGATIETKISASMIGSTANDQNGTVTIEKLTFKNIDPDGYAQIRFDNNTNQPIDVSGLTLAGQDQSTAVLFSNDSFPFSATFEKGYNQTYYHAPADLAFDGITLLGNLASFDVGLLGNPSLSDEIFTYNNVDIGSEIRVETGASDGAYRRGAVEVKTDVTIKVTEADGTPIEGAKSYLPTYDDGNQSEPNGRSVGWTTEPAYTFNADANGEDTQSVQVCTIVNKGSLPSTNDITYSYRSVSGTNADDFKYVSAAYGYQPFVGSLVAKGDTGVLTNPRLLVDSGVTANEATASGYNMSYSNSTKILTINAGTFTASNAYDFMKYTEKQNPQYIIANGDEPLVKAIQPGLFDFDDVRIVLNNGATLNIDDDSGIIVWSALPEGSSGNYQNYIRVLNGATLNTGTDGSQNTICYFGRLDVTSASWLDYNQDILVESGGTWNWYGGIIRSTNAVWGLTGSALNVSGNAQIFSDTASSAAFRFSGVDTVITQLLLNNGAMVWFTIPTVPLQGISFKNVVTPQQCIVGLDNDGVTGEFILAKGFDISDPSIDKGYAHWDSRWARLSNHADGTDLVASGNLADDPRNKGLLEVRQEISFSADSGSGAKFYTKDTNNGSRLAANQIVDNPDYVADRDYTLTESSGTASYTTDGGVLTGVYWRSVGGVDSVNNEFDSHGINNDNTDIFNWLKVQYGFQPNTLDVVMKGTSAVQSSIGQLLDLGITEANKTTVSAYTGITPVYSGGVLTVSITSNHTWNEVYDYIKYWESENPASVWANGKSSFVSTSNKLTYSFNNFVIVVTGANLTTSSGQILPTKPTVNAGGFFEDSEGAIWNVSGTVYYGNAIKYTALEGATPVQGVKIAHFDSGGNNRTYNSSRTLVSALESDADGEVEGYAVYKINSTSYANHTLVAREYEYNNISIPKTLNGLAVEENISLNADNFIDVSEAVAGSYTFADFNTTTKLATVDQDSPTIQKLYDAYKYYITDNVDKTPFFGTSDGTTFAFDTDWDLLVTGSNVSLVEETKRVNYAGTGALAIEDGALFEDITHACWEDGGDVYFASHVYLNVRNAGTSANISGAVIAWGDGVTQTRLAYNTSRGLDTLVTDASGNVEGYFVYKINSTTYTDTKQITAEYNHIHSIVPRTLSGSPIGSSSSREVMRLATDNEVTLSKAHANALPDANVDVATDTIDLVNNNLSESYDNLKYQVTANADIDTGIPGCMYLCLYGIPLAKSGDNYTGRTATTIYQNMDGADGTFQNGVVELDTAGTYSSFTFGEVQINFEGAGTYDFRASTFQGAVTVDTIGDHTVTAKFPVGLSITNDDPTNITVEQSEVFPISGTNIADDSLYYIYNSTKDTYIVSGGVVSGGSGLSENRTLGTGEEIEAGDSLIIVVDLYGKQTVRVNRVASSGGLTFTDEQVDDTITTTFGQSLATALSYDQSEGDIFLADIPNIQIDFAGTGTFVWGSDELYVWSRAKMATDGEFQKAFSGMWSSRSTIGQLIVDVDVIDVMLDNPNAGTIAKQTNSNSNIVGRPALLRSDDASIEFARTDGGKIILNPSIDVVVAVVNTTGTPVITGDIADVWTQPERTLTSGGGGGTTPEEIWTYSDRTLTSGGGGASPEEIDEYLTQQHGGGSWNKKAAGSSMTTFDEKQFERIMKQIEDDLSKRELKIDVSQKDNEKIAELFKKLEELKKSMPKSLDRKPIDEKRIHDKLEKQKDQIEAVEAQIAKIPESQDKMLDNIAELILEFKKLNEAQLIEVAKTLK